MTSKLKRFFRKYTTDLWFSATASALVPIFFRARLWRIFGVSIGRKCYIGANCQVIGKNLKIGETCVFGFGVYLDATGHIEIGDHSHIGPFVRIISAGHSIQNSVRRRDPSDIEKTIIRIGRGSWVGTGTIILPGVQIGEGCVIGAGSVVTKDCLPNSLYVGSPARLVRDLSTCDDEVTKA